MLSKSLLRSIAGLLCVCTLQAQMTPSAPVQNFRLPRFGDNGYTQWVLQGGKGIYDSAEQIRIEEMALRVYSGDERMALEMTMDSPEATLLTTEKSCGVGRVDRNRRGEFQSVWRGLDVERPDQGNRGEV